MKIILPFVIILLLSSCAKQEIQNKFMPQNIHEPVAAGRFYPAEAGELKKQIEDFFGKASEEDTEKNIKAVMVPHAGYVFSGEVAAYSYKLLEGKNYNRVIIICNSHASYFDGVAVDASDAWRTPLGDVPVDKDFGKILAGEENININGEPFETTDQTIEVQLPFLQVALRQGFKIVPVLFGNTKDDSYQNLAEALEKNLGENDLVIISTDMSHYPSYEDANEIDQKTLELINAGNIENLENYIVEIEQKNITNEETLLCGIDGVKTAMELKNLLNWESEILVYKNSGDSLYGDKESVVGYGAIAFAQNQNVKIKNQNENGKFKILNKEQREILLNIAKNAIESYVKTGEIPDFDITDERLNWKEGAFVTLHEDGNLRGCIGQIVPTDALLWQVVRDMAIEAATEDPRFAPVKEKDLEKLEYEISVLSAPEKINDWQKIELGKHGVIVKKGRQSGVFLPQVAEETGWSLEDFLSQLCSEKAGLAPDCYKNDREVELYVFTAQVFGENDL